MPFKREKVSDVRGALDVLEQYAEREDQDFLNDEESIRAARYTFIVLVEAMTSIAGHICARGLNDSPASYADAFLNLARGGVLDEELAVRLGKMAGFRNLLVHGYAVV